MNRQRLRPITLAAAAAIALLSAGAASPASVYWTGPATANWASGPDGGLYWSTGTLPGPDDDVFIGTSGGYINVDYASVRSIHSSDGLNLYGGELELAAASSVAGIFESAYSSIYGSGSLTLGGAAEIQGSEVWLPLTSTLSLTMSASSFYAPLTTAGSTTFLSGVLAASWNNLGSLTLKSSLDTAFDFSNAGSVTQAQAASFRAGFTNSGSYVANASVSFAGNVLNTGTMTMSSTDYMNALQSASSFRNDGLVRITDGQAFITRALPHYGRLDATSIYMNVGIDGDGTQSLAVTGSAWLILQAGLPIRNTHLGGSLYLHSPWTPTLLENVTFDDGGASFYGITARGTITSLGHVSNAGGLTFDGPGATLAGLWSVAVSATNGTVVTLAPGSRLENAWVTASIENHGAVVGATNLGASTLNAADGSISISQAYARTGTIANLGSLVIDAKGPVFLGGLQQNSGSTVVGGQTQLFLGDTTVPDLHRVNFQPGARLFFTGLLDNAGGSYDLANPLKPLPTSGATLSGGRFTGGGLLPATVSHDQLGGLGYGLTLANTSIDALPALQDAYLGMSGKVHMDQALAMSGGLLRFNPGASFDNDMHLDRVKIDGLSVAAGRQATVIMAFDDPSLNISGAIHNDGLITLQGYSRIISTDWSGRGTTEVMPGATFVGYGYTPPYNFATRVVFDAGSTAFYWLYPMNIAAGGELDFQAGVLFDTVGPKWANRGVISLATGVALPGYSFDLAGGTLKLGLRDGTSFASLATRGGGLTLGGVLDIVAAPGADWQAGDRFVILSGGPVSGHFDALPDPLRWQLVYGAQDVTLVALTAAVPEPSARWLAALGLATLLLRRRLAAGDQAGRVD